MGIWGVGIFTDDYTCDIRDTYSDYIKIGLSDDDALNMIIEEFKDDFGTEYESRFWFALALTQWKKGRLVEFVRVKALQFLENNNDLVQWDTLGDQKSYFMRRKELEKLQTILKSPQPSKTIIRKPTVFHSPWKVGDLLAFKIKRSDLLKDEKYIGKYVLIRVVKINRSPLSYRVKSQYYNDTIFFGLYGWMGDTIPNPDIVKHLKYIYIRTEEDPLFGYIQETCFEYFFNMRELKKREIVVIDQDHEFDASLTDFFDLRVTRCGSFQENTIDFCLCEAYKSYLLKQDGISS